jgi:predicted choloylglycine hydrolase
MYHPRVSGSYYEMGNRYGAVLYKHGLRITEQSPEKLEFGTKSEPEVEHVFPEILEEIRGFADACKARYDDAAAFMFSIGAFKPEPMCSVFAASNDSDIIFGRNYDFFYSFRRFTESYFTSPENGHRSIGQSDVFIGREDGVNEKGLAIGTSGVETHEKKPGVSFCLAVRCVLDKCANVREATQMLSNIHHTAGFNFLLADREADLAVVEASPGRVRIRSPEKADNFMLCTNHYVLPEMQEMEDLSEREKANWDSMTRYTTIQAMLKKHGAHLSLKNAQEILANHTGYVCSHQEKIKLGTIWSITATLKEPAIFRAEGHPCRTRFIQDTRLKTTPKN